MEISSQHVGQATTDLHFFLCSLLGKAEITKPATIRKPPAIIEMVNDSPKKRTALSTVTNGSSVETKEALADPMIPSPAKNDQKATTVEKKAIASVAATPEVVCGSETPLNKAMQQYDSDALSMMKALLAIAVLVPTTWELMIM